MATMLIVPLFSSTILLLAGYIACLYAYRLYLHPLAKFPGPKTAAATCWYEFYYEVWLQGQYTFHIKDLHKKYGPIIRIAPNELHVDDPEYFDTLYLKSGRVDRAVEHTSRFGNGTSMFSTVSDSLHRLRRTPLNPFFSKRSIHNFQSILRVKVEQLLHEIAKYKTTGRPFDVKQAYTSITGDIIMQYCFSMDYNQVASPDFRDNFEACFMATSRQGHLGYQFPFLPRFMQKLPDHIVTAIEPLYSLMFKVQRDLRQLAVSQREAAKTWKGGHTNIFIDLINSDLPPEEKSDDRLQDEAQTLVAAGVVTTAWALSFATFEIVRDPAIYQRLRQELEEAIPDPSVPLQWTQLEQLPYLTGCIKEALRRTYGVTGRVPRVVSQPMQYKNWVIPAGTPIGLSIMDIHDNPDIFPEPHEFKPERWLNQPRTKNGDPLDRFLVSFLKGNRSCLGLNLAWCELYLVLAGVMRNFEFELYKTDETDVQLKHDFTIPSPRLDSEGVRVTVKRSTI